MYLAMAPLLQSTFDCMLYFTLCPLMVDFWIPRHLHKIMHAIVATPPSQSPPAILVLAHKCDLLKTGGVSGTSLEQLGINRVRTVLERELDKRRRSHTGSVAIDELGAEGEDTSELGGLDSIGPPGEAFKFAEWEGGEIEFIGSWVSIGETVELEDEKGGDSVGDGSSRLSSWLQALH